MREEWAFAERISLLIPRRLDYGGTLGVVFIIPPHLSTSKAEMPWQMRLNPPFIHSTNRKSVEMVQVPGKHPASARGW